MQSIFFSLASHASYSGCMRRQRHVAPQKKNTYHQAVYYLNAWEFATLWEVKLLPASGEAIKRLEARSARASGKNRHKTSFFFG